MTTILKVAQEDVGQRLDSFVSLNSENISRSRVETLISEGKITVNGTVNPKNYRVSLGDSISVFIEEPKTLDLLPEDIPLEIVYEDSDLLVVNKPKGMVVHPAPGNETGTLVNALLYHCGNSLSGINGVMRPGIVHRIDKNTSGLLIVAKNDTAHSGLASQIEVHSFTRRYQGVCFGHFVPENGTIRKPIGRSHSDRKKMAIDPDGRQAITHYQTLGEYHYKNAVWSHMMFQLETGRTHQIRVHMASMGHPILGDDVYGSPARDSAAFPKVEGQCLHAYHIGFHHPVTDEYLEFETELPAYFTDVLSVLKKEN